MGSWNTLITATLTLGIGIGTAQTLPAPTADRVGFPANYLTTFTKLLTVDRPDNGQIRVIWGNSEAASVNWWDPFPYGSVLLFESYTSKRDADGNFLFDADGHLIPNTLSTIFVRRKGVGFGADYQGIRNGEWEYVAYRPDGTIQTAPSASGACAACHLQAGPTRDWVFRRQSFKGRGVGVIPQFSIYQYAFVPGDITVKKGSVVTWVNNDDIEHQIFSPDRGFFSNVIGNGMTFTQKFDQAGEFEIRCSIHSGMKAKVTVKE